MNPEKEFDFTPFYVCSSCSTFLIPQASIASATSNYLVSSPDFPLHSSHFLFRYPFNPRPGFFQLFQTLKSKISVVGCSQCCSFLGIYFVSLTRIKSYFWMSTSPGPASKLLKSRFTLWKRSTSNLLKMQSRITWIARSQTYNFPQK